MKTTLDLPDDLMQAVKIRAVLEKRKLKDVVADLLRRGLARKRAEGKPARASRRVALPLVRCRHRARPGEEVTPDRLSEILAEQEGDDLGRAVR